MSAVESLREGNLGQALKEVQQQVRSDPSDAKQRIFLFQLLSVMGDWDRALTQLNVVGDLDDSALAMVQAYREVLSCETLRSAVFSGRHSPVLFGEPQEWCALMTQALRLDADGQATAAAGMRQQALEGAPATGGQITLASNEQPQPFDWLADADSRLGPIIEAYVDGRYVWIPVDRITTIDIEPPADLRDVAWMPVHFKWSTEGETVGLIPTRYVGSEKSEDDLIRLARKTDWAEPCEGSCFGLGQRMIATDQDDYAMMDIRKIEFHSATE